jgi:predicted nucleic acid-binding protein
MTLLDSDLLIDVQRGHPPAVAWMKTIRVSEFIVPGAAVLELLGGARNRVELDKASSFVSRLPIAWLSQADNELAAELVRRHRLSTGLGLADFLIAAQTLNARATLLTFNLKHFRSIPDLDAQIPYSR